MGILDSFGRKKPDAKSPDPTPKTMPKARAPAGTYNVGNRICGSFEIRQVLGGPGRSGMGIVYVCYDHESKTPVALKTLQDRFLSDHIAMNRFKREAETWVRLEKHFNIVRAIAVRVYGGRPYIVLEYVAGHGQYGADLSGWISGAALRQNGRPDIALILNFSLQFCHGMMHASEKFREMGKQFVHRDVKPSNILVTQDKVIKITDFGLVKALIESSVDIPSAIIGELGHHRLTLNKSGGICGTPPYMSPEQCRGEKDIDETSDIYSFGCVLYEMLTGSYVFEATRAQEFLRHHLSTPPRSPNSRTPLDKVVLTCLDKESSKRYQQFGELEHDLARLYRDLTGDVVSRPQGSLLEAWELHNKGLSLDSLGFQDEAIRSYREALSIIPDSADTHSNLAVVYREKGQLDDAIRECQHALRINPNHVGAHNNLGNAYRAKDHLDAAIAEYREALRINPNFAEGHHNLANAYDANGQMDEAISETREALRINPNYAKAHADLGTAYVKRGQLDAAIAEYQKALRIDPNQAEAQYSLGGAYYAHGQMDAAIQAFEDALRINSNDTFAHLNLGNAYFTKGQLDAAVAEYQKALSINPHDAGIHYNLANVYSARGQIEEAIAKYREALRINPNFVPALYNLGNLYRASGRLTEAIQSYTTFVRLASPEYEAQIKEAQTAIRILGGHP